jgi:hypothetical protein
MLMAAYNHERLMPALAFHHCHMSADASIKRDTNAEADQGQGRLVSR